MNIFSRNRNILPSIWVVSLILVFCTAFGGGNVLGAPIGINLATSSVTITHNPLPGVLPADSVGRLAEPRQLLLQTYLPYWYLLELGLVNLTLLPTFRLPRFE